MKVTVPVPAVTVYVRYPVCVVLVDTLAEMPAENVAVYKLGIRRMTMPEPPAPPGRFPPPPPAALLSDPPPPPPVLAEPAVPSA